ncbi:MAG: glycosyltransferase [Acidobacteriota bacterium]
MTARRVAVVVPTFNAGPGFEAVLDAIQCHGGDVEVDIVALDSGSTDGTVECLRRRGARILTVPPGRFNHGETRNDGLACADGEFAVLLVQDAVPAAPGWIDALLAPLRADARVAGSFARQLPAPGASRLTVHQLSAWIAAGEAPRTVGPLTGDELAAMTPAARHQASAFDNVCSCVRLSVWRSHPFRRTPIAEDLEWGLEVLRAGFILAYTPEAAVRHSHERTVRYELQRTYLVHQRLQALFGLQTIPTLGALLRAVGVTVPLHLRLAASEPSGRPRAICRGLGLGVAWPLGQYLGARSSRDGRPMLRTGRI